MKAEHLARVILILLVVGLSGAAISARMIEKKNFVELHGRMAEDGGWTPEVIFAQAGKPLLLRLTSDDVMHGFAVGQSEQPEVDIQPGETVDITLNFEQPGEYTFYCTRWCGLNHWRMRGTIQVEGDGEPASEPADQPAYMKLGLDIDAPHKAQVVPVDKPGDRDVPAGVELQAGYLDRDYYRSHAPAQVFIDLRADSNYTFLSDAEIWGLVAQVWIANATPDGIERGEQLYRQNCAACHGENGQGDGVFAGEVSTQYNQPMSGMEYTAGSPADFTNMENMLGASPALLQGKILRGGMGTGMPYWGPIFTEEETWDLVAFLYTFTMDLGLWDLP